MRTYKELMSIQNFEDRLLYLMFDKPTPVGNPTKFRYLNQRFYGSVEWSDVAAKVITRDDGNDLGCDDRPILCGGILVHHIEPLTLEDFETCSDRLLNMDNLISVSLATHNAIHYRRPELATLPKVRRLYDTCPWKGDLDGN